MATVQAKIRAADGSESVLPVVIPGLNEVRELPLQGETPGGPSLRGRGGTISIKDLAGAQVRTEGKLEELADAQNRTEAKVEELARRR